MVRPSSIGALVVQRVRIVHVFTGRGSQIGWKLRCVNLDDFESVYIMAIEASCTFSSVSNRWDMIWSCKTCIGLFEGKTSKIVRILREYPLVYASHDLRPAVTSHISSSCGSVQDLSRHAFEQQVEEQISLQIPAEGRERSAGQS